MSSAKTRRLIGLVLVLACTTALSVSSTVRAQEPVSEIGFDSVPNPLKLPPDMNFGEVTGIAVNSKNHVFVFSRGNTSGPAYGATAAQLLTAAGVTP